MLVTVIGNCGKRLVEFADWLDEKYARAPKTLVEQIERSWTKERA